MNRKFFSASFLTSLLFVVVLGISSCKKDDDKPNNEVKFQNIALTGANERPPVASTNTGTFNGTYNKDTKMLTYTVTWSGFTATNMHFHKADINSSAPPLIPVEKKGTPLAYTSPLTETTRALTAAEEADLLNGLWYINIHSAQFPTGELRGQLVK